MFIIISHSNEQRQRTASALHSKLITTYKHITYVHIYVHVCTYIYKYIYKFPQRVLPMYIHMYIYIFEIVYTKVQTLKIGVHCLAVKRANANLCTRKYAGKWVIKKISYLFRCNQKGIQSATKQFKHTYVCTHMFMCVRVGGKSKLVKEKDSKARNASGNGTLFHRTVSSHWPWLSFISALCCVGCRGLVAFVAQTGCSVYVGTTDELGAYTNSAGYQSAAPNYRPCHIK